MNTKPSGEKNSGSYQQPDVNATERRSIGMPLSSDDEEPSCSITQSELSLRQRRSVGMPFEDEDLQESSSPKIQHLPPKLDLNNRRSAGMPIENDDDTEAVEAVKNFDALSDAVDNMKTGAKTSFYMSKYGSQDSFESEKKRFKKLQENEPVSSKSLLFYEFS